MIVVPHPPNLDIFHTLASKGIGIAHIAIIVIVMVILINGCLMRSQHGVKTLLSWDEYIAQAVRFRLVLFHYFLVPKLDG